MKAKAKDAKKISWVLTAASTAAVIALLLAGFWALDNLNGGSNAGKAAASPAPADGLRIAIEEISSKPAFYPLRIGGVDMEVIALRASDGSIRTAFNTCQVCFSSGRGYYKAEGNALVCQNCGNRFTTDMVGVREGGCNPVPILAQDREESDGILSIPREYLERASAIFENWKQ